MGKSNKFVSAVVGSVTAAFGVIAEVVDSSPRSPAEQASSHYEQRADDRSRRRTRTVQSSTRNAGNRRRGSGQRGEKPARLDHRYNG